MTVFIRNQKKSPEETATEYQKLLKHHDREKHELEFLYWIKIKGLPVPEREYRFHSIRKWRFDFAYPDRKIGIEIEGGTFTFGRHVRGTGFQKDCEKYNEAALLGWRILRFTGRDLTRGCAADFVQKVLGVEPAPKLKEKARREAFEVF